LLFDAVCRKYLANDFYVVFKAVAKNLVKDKSWKTTISKKSLQKYLQPAPMVCPYTCDVCDLRFSDYPSMLEHVKERRHIFRKKKSEYIASR